MFHLLHLGVIIMTPESLAREWWAKGRHIYIVRIFDVFVRRIRSRATLLVFLWVGYQFMIWSAFDPNHSIARGFDVAPKKKEWENDRRRINSDWIRPIRSDQKMRCRQLCFGAHIVHNFFSAPGQYHGWWSSQVVNSWSFFFWPPARGLHKRRENSAQRGDGSRQVFDVNWLWLWITRLFGMICATRMWREIRNEWAGERTSKSIASRSWKEPQSLAKWWNKKKRHVLSQLKTTDHVGYVWNCSRKTEQKNKK